jgi:Tat protein translocase TatB subunit
MFDIGFQELVLIMVLALIVFGPSKLPELGKKVGRALREFRRASDEFRSTVETNLKINEIDPEPSIGVRAGSGYTYGPAPAHPDGVDEHRPAESVGDGGLRRESVPEGAEASPDGSAVATIQSPGEPYCAQRGSRIFHRRECTWVARIPEGERLGFPTVVQAQQDGFKTCPVCEP